MVIILSYWVSKKRFKLHGTCFNEEQTFFRLFSVCFNEEQLFFRLFSVGFPLSSVQHVDTEYLKQKFKKMNNISQFFVFALVP